MKTVKHYLVALLTVSLSAAASYGVDAPQKTADPSQTQKTVSMARENPGALPVLASLDHVANDLHLTSLQRSVIAGLRSDYRAAALKLTQIHYQTAAEVAKAQKELDTLAVSFNHRVIAALNTLQQHRLREIERQKLGGSMLVSPSEQKMLGLTDVQKQEIETIHQDSYKHAMAINLRANQGKLDQHQHVVELRKNRKKHAAAMLKVLTPAQLKIWNDAQGVKVDLLKK